MVKKQTQRRERERFVVILPENLPFSGSSNADLHRAYREIPKVGASSAVSTGEAMKNVLYNGFSDKKNYRVISAKMKDLDVKLDAEVHPIEFVRDGSGKSMNRDDIAYFKSCFLAQSIANTRGGEAHEYLNEARSLLDRVS